MTLTLIVSLTIVAFGLLGLFNLDRTNRFLDNILKGLGKLTRDILKYSLFGLFALLWVASAYSVYIYATEGVAPTLSQSLDSFVGDVEGAADYSGDRAKELLGGADHVTPYADVRGLSSSDSPVDQKYEDLAGQYEYKAGPNIRDLTSGVHGGFIEHLHTPRLHTGGDECSRTIKDSGNCHGVSRHFVDDQHINTCNKIFVTAPQALPFNGAVNFAL